LPPLLFDSKGLLKNKLWCSRICRFFIISGQLSGFTKYRTFPAAARRIQVEGATFFSLNDPEKGRPQFAEVYDLRKEASQARLAGKVSAAANAGAPGQFSLAQNYPNPFNPSTTIEFQLPQASHVTLKIYDLQGRLVKTLADGEFPAGTHRVKWDGRDEREMKRLQVCICIISWPELTSKPGRWCCCVSRFLITQANSYCTRPFRLCGMAAFLFPGNRPGF